MDILDALLEKFSKNMMKKNKDVGTVRRVSVAKKTDIVSDFIKTKNNYYNKLNQNLNGFIKGQLSKEDFLSKQREVIDRSFKTTYRLGKEFTQSTEKGLSSDEVRSMGYQVGKEMAFMIKFAEDIENGEGRMNYKRRMKMYSDSLLPIFLAANAAYLGADVPIHWVLGRTDKHCVDCISLSSNSPYVRTSLPTVPKAGGTRCISNCKCHLEFPTLGETSKYFQDIIDNYKSGGDIPTQTQMGRLNGYKSLYYQYRALAHVENDKEMMKMAKKQKALYSDYIKRHDLSLKKTLPLADFLKEIDIFEKCKNAIRITNTENLVGEIVSVHHANTQLYVKVVSSDGYVFSAKDLSGQTRYYNVLDSLIYKVG